MPETLRAVKAVRHKSSQLIENVRAIFIIETMEINEPTQGLVPARGAVRD